MQYPKVVTKLEGLPILYQLSIKTGCVSGIAGRVLYEGRYMTDDREINLQKKILFFLKFFLKNPAVTSADTVYTFKWIALRILPSSG